MTDQKLTRRTSLVRIGGVLATALGAAGIEARASEGSGPAAVASGEVACVLAPEQTEGPYYIANEAVRRNITEGRPGHAAAAAPVGRRRLDLQADQGCRRRYLARRCRRRLLGVWSRRLEPTFLRGVQRTDANGLAFFATVYPGWYQGRTVHIHVKVHLGGNVVHTGQLYFPDSVTDAVYKKAPYTNRPNRTTRNADDSIYRNGGKRSQVSLRKTNAGVYVATITMGVHRS